MGSVPIPAVRAVRNGESAINRKLFREDGGGDLVEARSAVLLGNSAAKQANFAGLLNQLRHQAGLLVFQFLDEGENFLDDKFLSGLADQFLVVGEVGRCKDVLRKGSLEKKTSALGGWFGDRCGGHRRLLVAL